MICMNEITIEIHYVGDSKAVRRGSYPRRGRRSEQIALQFWQDIKKEMSYHVDLEEVLAAGEDITEKVKELEKQQFKHIINDDLPF